MQIDDYYFLEIAYQQAIQAQNIDEVPVGCCIVKDHQVLATGYNTRENEQDVMGHAEINAIKQAQRTLGSWRLIDCDLYVTLEPCPMCAGAIIQSRIRRVVYAAFDMKWGAHQSKINLFSENLYNHNVDIIHLEDTRCSELLKSFFKKKRSK